jgi:outer membrane immunogenic protein
MGLKMRKTGFTAGALALALSAGSAFAADLPSTKAPPYFPPPPPPPMWTGFYVGLNAGGTWSESHSVSVSSFPGFCDVTRNGCGVFVPSYGAAMATAASFIAPSSSGGGFIGGGQVGYNYQFANNFVAGIEADIQGVASSGNNSNILTGALGGSIFPAPGFPLSSIAAVGRSIDYLGTVRGRLGYLVTPTLLAYGTGGLAYGGVHSSVDIVQSFFTDPSVTAAFGNGVFSDTRVGWTAGGGLEWMFWPNWSGKVEYLYYDLGNVTYAVSPLISLSNATGTVTGSAIPHVQTRFNGHIVRAGLNYHFNWSAPAPVVAKY